MIQADLLLLIVLNVVVITLLYDINKRMAAIMEASEDGPG